MSCDGNCKYKRLYEGSQASLNDLAAKQASALRRATKLRVAILDAVKQHFPNEYTQAEISLGKQLSSMDDDVIVAYLAAFMSKKDIAPAPSHELENLRAHLGELGVSVPANTDPGTWISAAHSLLIKEEEPGAFDPPNVEDLIFVEGQLLTDLFEADDVPNDLADLFGSVEPVEETDLANDLFSEDVPPAPEADDEAPEESTEFAVEEPATETVEPEGETTQEPVAKGEQLGLNGPVKPEVVKQVRKSRRQPRVSASGPSNGADLSVLKDAGKQPFFLREGVADLSSEQVSNLETAIRSAGSEYVLIKGRNAKQGSLVIPKSVNGSDSPWAQCVSNDALRGQSLYEVATLLSRNTGRVLGCVPGKEVTSLTMQGNGGVLLALFVGNGDLSPTSELRAELAQILAREVSADHEAIVLLTSARKTDAPHRIATAVAGMAAEAQWNVAVPVVAGSSATYQVASSNQLTHVLP